MEEYPSNSHKSRGREQQPPPSAPEKKVERVVQGEVIRRKKPMGRRLASYFFGSDARGAAGDVFLNVLIPAIKHGFLDTFHEGIDHVFDNDRRHSRGRGRPGGGSYVSYGRYADDRGGRHRDSRDRDEPRHMSRRGRANHNFDEIIMPTKYEAEEIIDRLFDLVGKYEVATVSDLYDMAGITATPTDEKWGWDDLRGLRAIRVRGGYLLDLPRPEPID